MLVQDASGGQEFFYGPLGEVIKTIRTVQMGESDMRTWIWSASYDTWNRIRTMSYPDGEKVTYTYNRAGNLNKMDGEKLGRNYAYISRIGYNKSEKQEYLQYSNGTVTTYFYEPERQRLKQMSLTADSKELMNNVYTYDALNNIRGITNNTASIGDIGGTTSHLYNYDDLNRLTNASGIFTGKKDTSNYALDIKYDIMGDLLRKTQTHDTNREKQAATSYDFEYKYDGLKPNAATKIGDRIFTYDENGNQTNWEDTATNDFRQLSWDEENRLTLVSDNGYLNRYIYDASGERVIKSHGGSQGVYINGAPAGIVNHSDNKYTIYVSPYFVLQNERFTKHYYAGSSRVISKIGNGQFENQYRLGVFEITAGKVNYIYRQQQILNDKKAFEEKAGIPPGPPTMKGIYADPLYSGIAYTDGGTPDTITPRGWPKKPIFAPAGGPPGAPIQWGTDITNDNADPGFGYVGTGNIEEDLRYFYHSDQLGSTNYITDAKGNIKQFIAYMPFGEILSEQHADWDSPYKFNAKERDTETGLYYYGARYYDPKASLWISTDPLAENYIGWNSYNYTFDNPVRYIDPDGMGPEDDLESGKSKKIQQPQKPLTFRNPIISAKQVDAEFIKSYKGDGKAQAPYEEGTSTKEIYTAAGESFIRVYTSGNTKPQGKWLTKYSVIRGLSPKEIQAKLALPNVPTHMVEVKPPANTLLRLGKTGPAFGQPGGGIQYEAIGKEFIPKSAFGNPTMLPKVAPVIAPIEKPLPITAPYGKRFQSYVKFFNQL
jgi:RHS repeat-associated protein